MLGEAEVTKCNEEELAPLGIIGGLEIQVKWDERLDADQSVGRERERGGILGGGEWW